MRRLLSVAAWDVPSAIVEEAQARGRCAAALYVLDLEGLRLRLLSGSPWWPHELEVAPGAVGSEMPSDAVEGVAHSIRCVAPDAAVLAVAHDHAAIAFLVWERPPLENVDALAGAAAVALDAADRRTDVIARARRARATSPAAEVQENLLPPRLMTLAGGGQLAGAIVPAYAFGGDWFDYAENADDVWLAVADATGAGVPAAAASLLSLGAYRSARRSRASIGEAARLMDQTVKELGDPARFVTALLARWVPATNEFEWLRFGHPLPILVRADGTADPFGEDGHLPLGLLDEGTELIAQSTTLSDGDRVVLTSDGVWERQAVSGRRLEMTGIRPALEGLAEHGAARAVSAVTALLRHVSAAPLDDDATVVCLAVPLGSSTHG